MTSSTGLDGVIARFHQLFLGDSWLQIAKLRIGEATCDLTFSCGLVLEAEGASIFDPKIRFAPALLRFSGVRSICCEGAKSYQLNSCVVDFGARLSRVSDHVDFYFDLAGGVDADAYIVTVTIAAKDFEFRQVEL